METYDIVESLGKCHGCGTYYDEANIEPVDDGRYYSVADVDFKVLRLETRVEHLEDLRDQHNDMVNRYHKLVNDWEVAYKDLAESLVSKI